MVTGGDGKFEFRNLVPGRYQVRASRNGYLDGAFGRRGRNGTGSSLNVAAGDTMKDVRITMIPTGAISGRVYDANGDPIANIPVRALKYSYSDGLRKLGSVKTASTNDRGEYRLFWLPPGQYYVSAEPIGLIPNEAFFVSLDASVGHSVIVDPTNIPRVNRSDVERLGETNLPVYYPGVMDPQSATALEVRPGADLGAVDFTLARARTHKLTFIALDSTTGQPATNLSAVLVPRSAASTGLVSGTIITSRRVANDGTFEMQGVAPGSYTLVATQRSNNGREVKTTGATVPVEIGGQDVERLSLVLTPGIDLRGHVTVEADRSGSVHHPTVGLRNDIGGSLPGRQSPVWAMFDDDQDFALNTVLEGNYQVQLSGLPESAYVKSVRFGSADALNGTMRIDSRSTERLDIVLSMNAGTLEGAVVNANREPVTDATVVLVPDAAHRQRNDLYKNATTDDSGRFQLKGIAPGEYSVFAWEDIDIDLWQDSEFPRRNEAAGKPLHINEGAHETIELVAIPFAF